MGLEASLVQVLLEDGEPKRSVRPYQVGLRCQQGGLRNLRRLLPKPMDGEPVCGRQVLQGAAERALAGTLSMGVVRVDKFGKLFATVVGQVALHRCNGPVRVKLLPVLPAVGGDTGPCRTGPGLGTQKTLGGRRRTHCEASRI